MSQPSTQNLDPFLNVFRHAGGLFDVEPCEMDLNIGRRAIRNTTDEKKNGTISVEPFTVIAVQKDYKGDKIYRIVYDSETRQIGCCFNPTEEDFRWLTEQV